MGTIRCACLECDETVTTEEAMGAWSRSDDGQLYCPACIDYATTSDGDVLCGTHSIPGDIAWGPVMTGTSGSGLPHWQVGEDSNGTRWRREERGNHWTVPVPEE